MSYDVELSEDNDTNEIEDDNKKEQTSFLVSGDNTRHTNEQIVTEDLFGNLVFFKSLCSSSDTFKQIEIRRRAEEQHTTLTKLKSFVLDFRLRWTTTYIMLSRFITFSGIITDIILSPSSGIGLTKQQYGKLSFSRDDWLCLSVLQLIVNPFYRATALLSSSRYPNLIITLKKSLCGKKSVPHLIAGCVDLTSYRSLDSKDLLEAGQLILAEPDIHPSLERLQINNSATTTNNAPHSSISSRRESTPSNTRSRKVSSLDEFLRICEMPLSTNVVTLSVIRRLPFKEELYHYMVTARIQSNFTQYWLQHGERLPQLLQFVKRYNCISATSVPSESAFSIAGHRQRKSRSSLSSTALRYSMILHE